MNRNRLLLFLLFSLLLSACAANPDVPAGTEWCYRWDFSDPAHTPSSYGFGIGTGSWQATVGIVTDSNFNLNATYVADLTVAPTRALITLTNTTLGNPAVSISAAGTIFGIPINVPAVIGVGIPAGEHTLSVPFDAPSLDTIGTNINVSMSASGEMAVRDLTVYGRGANPIGGSNCDTFVPTPAPTLPPSHTPFPTVAPATSTSTPAPTNTPSRTPTPSITPTSICEWVEDIDFSASMGGFAINTDVGSGAAIYGSGVGWKENHVVTGGGDTDVLFIRDQVAYSSTVTSIEIWTGGNFGNAYLINATVGSNSGYFVESQIQAGYAHAEMNWSISASQYMMFGHSNFPATGGHTTPDAYISRVRYRGAGNNPFTGGTCSTPTPLPTTTATQTFTSTPVTSTATRTPRPTWTTDPLITPTITRTPTRTLIPITVPATSIQGATAAPGATNTPDLVLTWIAGTSAATLAGTGGPPSTPTYSTFAPSVTPSRTPTSTAAPGSTYTPNPGGIGTPLPGGDERADLENVGDALLDTSSNAFEIVQSWLSNISVPFARIVNAYYTTAPVPPPGMTRCHTAPLESDLCAIWYILEFTIFSGPVGSLLVPIGTAIVDLVIIFMFMKQGRAIIARLMEIVKTG